MTNYTNTQGDCAQFLQHFANEAAQSGYTVPAEMLIDRWVRGASAEKGERNKSTSFFVFPDCHGGLIHDHVADQQIHIKAARNSESKGPRKSPVALAADNEKRLRVKAETESKGAKKAQWIFREAVTTNNHEYAHRKGFITPHAIVRYSPKYKTLVLPIRDAFTDEITSLQYIGANGEKRFMPGGRIKGCYIACNVISDQFDILLCEGFATGCSLAEAYPDAIVMAAHSCHNLKPVAKALKNRWPERRLIICGDDDRANPRNPGRTGATAAAQAVGADLMVPNWPDDTPLELTDFNDLALWLRAQKASNQ